MDIPNDYKTAGMLNMVSGGFNLMLGGLWFISLIWVCIGLFWVVPMAIGGWQAFVGYNMYSGQAQPNAKTAAIAGLVGSLLNFNIIGAACSGFAMMNVDKPEVKGWLEQQGV